MKLNRDKLTPKPEMNLMIDLETLGTEPDAPVIAIGAVFFDKEGLKEEFYKTLDFAKQIDKGRKPSWDTMKWWMFQDNKAKKIFKDIHADTELVLKEFAKFCQIYKAKPWGNGSGFDITILEDIFRMYGIKIPWSFWRIRDYRTFKQLFPKEIEREGVYHNALDDSKHQANNLITNLKEFPEFKI